MGIKIGNENKITKSKFINNEIKKAPKTNSKVALNIVIPLIVTIIGGIIVGLILEKI